MRFFRLSTLATCFVFSCALLPLAPLALRADITPEEAAKSEGQFLTVTGKVESARRSAAGALYLNFGAAYPNQTFSVFVSKGDAANFPEADTYTGKIVSATGLITLREGKAQMQVKAVEGVVIKDEKAAQ